MEICGVCAVAPLGPEDRFCFFCASPLRKLEVALSAAAVVAGGEEDESWLEGAVRNAGQFGNRARLLPVGRSF